MMPSDSDSLRQFFGFDPLLPKATRKGSNVDRASLERFRELAVQLRSELITVAEDLGLENADRITFTYCVDFEVIYSAHNWFEARARESAWSRTALDMPASRVVLLPGAMFEFVTYLTRAEKELTEALGSNLARSFLRAFENEFEHFDKISDLYREIQERLRKTKPDEKLRYLNWLLVDRLDFDSGFAVEPDLEIFSHAAYRLSQGNRIERPINNRVDALDFAILCNLNRASLSRGRKRSNEFFVMLTGARSFRRLESLAPSFWSKGFGQRPVIRSPKNVAIHELLRVAGNMTGESEDLAWKTVQLLVEYINEIDTALRENQLRMMHQGSWDTPEDLIVELLLAIDAVEGALKNADSRRERRIGELTLPSDPNEREFLLRSMQTTLWRILERAGASKLFHQRVSQPRPLTAQEVGARPAQARPAVPSPMETLATGAVSEALQVISMSTADRPIAHLYNFGQFFSLCLLSKVPLDQFLSAFNLVRNSCAAQNIEGGWAGPPKLKWGVEVGVRGATTKFHWRDLPLPIDALGLTAALDCNVEDIQFLRLDTAWFDASYEAGYCAIASHLDILDDVSEFARLLTWEPVDSTEFQQSIAESLGGLPKKRKLVVGTGAGSH